jgi:uncharacterized protein YbbC (DUF1343 family)
MIETTNISVGRGTDTPFELVGAPWISLTAATALAGDLNAREISGVRFVPEMFTPSSSIYANQLCGGVNVIVTDRNALDGPELGIEVASALLKRFPAQYKLAGLDTLMVNQMSLEALTEGEDPQRIALDWQEGIEKFNMIRSKYLMY